MTEPIPAGPRTILIIDDEEGIRNVAARMLERLGFKAMICADGPAGIAWFGAHADETLCVLLDLTMPLMSGEATLRELRAISPAAPVVLMSGHGLVELGQRFGQIQPTAFLQKPFNLTALREMLEVVTQAGR